MRPPVSCWHLHASVGLMKGPAAGSIQGGSRERYRILVDRGHLSNDLPKAPPQRQLTHLRPSVAGGNRDLAPALHNSRRPRISYNAKMPPESVMSPIPHGRRYLKR